VAERAEAVTAKEKATSILQYEQTQRRTVEDALMSASTKAQNTELTLQKALTCVPHTLFAWGWGRATDACGRFAWDLGVENLADYLIDAGCDVNATDREGYSILHTAAAQGKVDLVRKLLAKNALVDARNRHNATPLHQARATSPTKSP
jgi:hypothetical protein